MTLSNLYKKHTLFELICEILLTKYGLKITSATADSVSKFINSNPEIYNMDLQAIEEAVAKNLDIFFLNNETHFFRNHSQIEQIINITKSQNISNPKILSFGCSSGEECYSLAMAFNKSGIKKYEIHGIDIDEDALKKAEKGIYTENSFRNMPKEFSIFFEKTGQFYKVKSEVKRNVHFYNINLLKEDILNYFPPECFNFILVNNVLIYLSQKAIELILTQLNNVLSKNGLLFTTEEEFLLISETKIFIQNEQVSTSFKKKNLVEIVKKEFRELFELEEIKEKEETEQIYHLAETFSKLDINELKHRLNKTENIIEKNALLYSLFTKTMSHKCLKDFIDNLIETNFEYEAKKWLKTYLMMIDPTEKEINDYIELCIKAGDYQEAIKMLEKKVNLFQKEDDKIKLSAIKSQL